MSILEAYDKVRDDALRVLEQFGKEYRKRERKRVRRSTLVGTAAGAAGGAALGGVGALPGAAVGLLAGHTYGKYRAMRRRRKTLAKLRGAQGGDGR